MSLPSITSSALQQFQKLHSFTKSKTINSTHKTINSSNTSSSSSSFHGAAPTSSSMKTSNDLSKVLQIQSQIASYRVNQETQTNDDNSNYCRNCCIMAHSDKKKNLNSGTRGISDAELKEWAFQQALMEMQVSIISLLFIIW